MMMSMAKEKGSMLFEEAGEKRLSCQHCRHRQLCAAIGIRGLNSPLRGLMSARDA
jgi:hypothetical protein